jgi:Peptidase family M23
MFARIERSLTVLVALTAACSAELGDSAGGHIDPLVSASSVAGQLTSAFAVQSVSVARPVATTDGQSHLVYELFFENTSAEPLHLEAIDVADPDGGLQARFDGDALQALTTIVNSDGTEDALAPGGRAIVYFDLQRTRSERLPGSLTHRIKTSAAASAVAGPTVSVVDASEAPLAPPLRGGGLLVGNGCCDSGHRRAILAVHDGLFVAQRFAIDFVRIEGLSTFSGEPTLNASYHVYGAEALAVGDGWIADIVDGTPENVPTEPLPPLEGPAAIESAPGNHVVLALHDGRFVLYAHLQPGSIAVQPGDEVRSGQRLGLVGNSGNSTEPHLHLHVMDGPAPLASDGLPYTFDAFRLEGRVDSSAAPPAVVPTLSAARRRAQLPMDLDVIAFP